MQDQDQPLKYLMRLEVSALTPDGPPVSELKFLGFDTEGEAYGFYHQIVEHYKQNGYKDPTHGDTNTSTMMWGPYHHCVTIELKPVGVKEDAS